MTLIFDASLMWAPLKLLSIKLLTFDNDKLAKVDKQEKTIIIEGENCFS